MHRFISRDETGLPAPKNALQATNVLKDEFYFHHTVTPVSDNPFADLRRVTNYNSFIDIPYNVLTHPRLLGDAMMGRFLNGVPALGAHTGGRNTKGHGLARIGNYMTGNLDDDALLEGEVFAIVFFIEKGWIPKQFKLIGHRAAPGQATACPGTVFFNKLTHITELVRGRGLDMNISPLPPIQTPQQPLSNAPAYPMLLLKGTRGNYVKQFQRQLIALGYKLPKYGADGDFGNETFEAVKQFQQDRPLEVDGKVGKNTWKALFATTPVGQPGPSVLHVGFSLPGGHYYGKFKERKENHSGYYLNDRPAIRMIQQKLGLIADGGFGDNTHNAVVGFQKREGLAVDGLVGPNTWKKLFS